MAAGKVTVVCFALFVKLLHSSTASAKKVNAVAMRQSVASARSLLAIGVSAVRIDKQGPRFHR